MKIHYFTGGLVVGKFILAVLVFWLTRNFSLSNPQDFLNLLWGGVISNVVFMSIVAYFSLRELYGSIGKIFSEKLPLIRFNFVYWKKILAESLPFGLALILQTLYLRLDVVLISIMLGSAAVGTYGVATRLLESLLVLGVFFGHAILPKISAEEVNHKQTNKTLGWAIAVLMMVVSPILIAVPAYASDIILVLSSTEFLSSGTFFGSDSVLAVLIITVFFAYLNQLFTVTLVSKNRQKYLMIVNGAALTLNFILNILFLKSHGLIAAALSTVLCEMLVFGLLIKEIRRFFAPQLSWYLFQPIVIANVILTALIYLTPLKEHFFLAIAVCGVSYLGIIYSFRKRFLS